MFGKYPSQRVSNNPASSWSGLRLNEVAHSLVVRFRRTNVETLLRRKMKCHPAHSTLIARFFCEGRRSAWKRSSSTTDGKRNRLLATVRECDGSLVQLSEPLDNHQHRRYVLHHFRRRSTHWIPLKNPLDSYAQRFFRWI